MTNKIFLAMTLFQDKIHILDKAARNFEIFLQGFCEKIKTREAKIDLWQRDLEQSSAKMLDVLGMLERNLSFAEQRTLRRRFLRFVSEYLFRSKLLERFYEKPRGYAGDFMMFEMIYENVKRKSGIGRYLDSYVLRYPFTLAIKNRKEKIKDIIRSFISNNNSRMLNMLNIGCGPSREIRELISEKNLFNKVNLTLLDQDRGSLEFSRRNICLQSSQKKIEYVERNALDLLGISKNQNCYRQKYYDLIYSLGIVDYLMDNVFERFLRFYYAQVKPKGFFIISCCCSSRSDIYLPLKWYSDWDLYIRDADETREFVRKVLCLQSVKLVWEKTGHIFFLIIRK